MSDTASKNLNQKTISELLKFQTTDDVEAFFVLIWEMAIETKKFGDHAKRIAIAGLTDEDIKRRIARMDFAREIIGLLDEKQRARIAPRILK